MPETKKPVFGSEEYQQNQRDECVALGYFWGRYDAEVTLDNRPMWADSCSEFVVFFLECDAGQSRIRKVFDEFVAKNAADQDTAVTS